MDPVSMSQQSYASQVISKALEKQNAALLQLTEAVKSVEVAQAKPLANLLNMNNIDAYA